MRAAVHRRFEECVVVRISADEPERALSSTDTSREARS
jgi:hypothetical protein